MFWRERLHVLMQNIACPASRQCIVSTRSFEGIGEGRGGAGCQPPLFVQVEAADADGFVEEGRSRLGKFFFGFRGIIGALPPSCASGIHFGVAAEVVLQAFGHEFTLRDDGDALGHVASDFGQEQGVVCASQYDGVYLLVLLQEGVDILLYKVVGTFALRLAILHERHPHGAGLPAYADVGVELADLHHVGFGLDGAGRTQHADVAGVRQVADALHGGADDAQHTAVGAHRRQVVDLDAAQGLGRSGVAGQYHQMASQFEQTADGLQGKFVDDVEGACAVGSTGVVAQIDEVVLGEHFPDFAQDGEASVTGVEYADGAGLGRIRLFHA